MRFAINKPRLQRTMEIVWGEWLATYRGIGPQYLRLEVKDDSLTISGNEAEASFPAEVIESGVLFVRATILDELLCQCPDLPAEKVHIESDGDVLRVNGMEKPLWEDDAILFDDPTTAPAQWSGEVPEEDGTEDTH